MTLFDLYRVMVMIILVLYQGFEIRIIVAMYAEFNLRCEEIDLIHGKVRM